MIEVAGLSKRYGDKTAVHDLTFTVAPGNVTGFLGPNGAGKSTTMRMTAGLDAPSAGSVRVNGHRYQNSAAARTRRLTRRGERSGPGYRMRVSGRGESISPHQRCRIIDLASQPMRRASGSLVVGVPARSGGTRVGRASIRAWSARRLRPSGR